MEILILAAVIVAGCWLLLLADTICRRVIG